MSVRIAKANNQLNKILSSQDDDDTDLLTHQWEVEQQQINQMAVNNSDDVELNLTQNQLLELRKFDNNLVDITNEGVCILNKSLVKIYLK